MRNMFRALTLVTALGALAPLAARADVGLHMYQPSPLITHVHHQRPAHAQANAPKTAQVNVAQHNG